MPRGSRRSVLALFVGAAAVIVGIMGAGPAAAHGFTSVVYADVSAGAKGHVVTTLQLEYDLLVVSAADDQKDEALFQDGTDAFDSGDASAEASVLRDHLDTVLAYVSPRFTVSSGGEVCVPSITGDLTMSIKQDAPYVTLVLDSACGKPSGDHTVASSLFPDSEQFVTGTKTILTYDIDEHTGSAALDAEQPTFSTEQSTGERFWEFFRLGAEHLLTGLDHILFLLALIAGSRRLREVVLAATAFTLAHSVTFILAATGVVSVPAAFVEPVIALSITAVAAWYLWRLWRRGDEANDFDTTRGTFGLDRAGWLRLAAVFVFGLVHGLGFASALGIDEPWSWTLLWSLLVFNVGIEAVQLTIIAIVFPLLMLLRRRTPRVGRWVTGAIAVVVSVAGLIWFVERVFQL
ncbi:HupE/UreJ family protein [Glaciihabitans sp. dw_435]|uniref:HupE/UreJ family protein n=1 Tax=Glaciihabitans sp. dw_435 TaxID=2720081 RepID=UPI001BD3D6FA|nr:HupE/UreJ family protein [Glaciihabitans sp. dw_435]